MHRNRVSHPHLSLYFQLTPEDNRREYEFVESVADLNRRLIWPHPLSFALFLEGLCRHLELHLVYNSEVKIVPHSLPNNLPNGRLDLDQKLALLLLMGLVHLLIVQHLMVLPMVQYPWHQILQLGPSNEQPINPKPIK